jgi:hypothetical protein
LPRTNIEQPTFDIRFRKSWCCLGITPLKSFVPCLTFFRPCSVHKDPRFQVARCSSLALALAALATGASPRPFPLLRCIVTETAVKVTTRHEGGATQFFVENDEYCEVTMTFVMGLQNMRGSAPFPFTATFPPRAKTEAFEVSPLAVGSKWGYSYTIISNWAATVHSTMTLSYISCLTRQETNSKSRRHTMGSLAIPVPTNTLLIGHASGNTSLCVARWNRGACKGRFGHRWPSIDYDRFNNYV